MFRWLLLSVTQCFRSEMKLNRASDILSYFFSKGSLLFANNKSISYKIDSFFNHSNCQNWCCLLTSAGEGIARARAREKETVIGNCTINMARRLSHQIYSTWIPFYYRDGTFSTLISLYNHRDGRFYTLLLLNCCDVTFPTLISFFYRDLTFCTPVN